MMKAHLPVFALTAIMIVSIGMTPAFGQLQSSIVITTDKPSYAEGETIVVSGEVRDLLGGIPVALVLKSPSGSIVSIDQIAIGADKKFSTEFKAGGLIKTEGTYTISATFGNNPETIATFEFGGVTPGTNVTQPPTSGGTSGITDTTISVEGSSDLIRYEITGGKILSVMPDVDAKSLIISIDATEDGSLTLTIPRSVLDSMDTDGADNDFFVLIDLEEVEFDETVSSTDRMLTISFPAGAEQIEIVGTFVVPEFGTIAAMILAVAIISIIAVSAKSRLSIMPRY